MNTPHELCAGWWEDEVCVEVVFVRRIPTARDHAPTEVTPRYVQGSDLQLALGAATVQAQTSQSFSGELAGDTERPGPGDPDGSGTFEVTLHPDRGEICYRLTVEEIQPVTAAHIHAGGAGAAGPVVVKLEPPADGSARDCTAVDRDLINAIISRPASYYVNVHNAELPGGAVRGQLGRPVRARKRN